MTDNKCPTFYSPQKVLKNAFDAFDQEKKGFIEATMVGTILSMLGHQLDDKMLADIIAEVDDDGSGQIEFAEFCTLAARFLVEEDAEAMQQELKEAFRLYDKEGIFLFLGSQISLISMSVQNFVRFFFFFGFWILKKSVFLFRKWLHNHCCTSRNPERVGRQDNK